jgi:Ssp1 endopeptidase immunity protein Rap1a
MIDSADRPSWKDAHESFSAGFCEGLVEGITYSSISVCPTKGVTITQEIRVVVKYLEDNPEKLNQHEAVLVNAALTKAFPCSLK